MKHGLTRREMLAATALTATGSALAVSARAATDSSDNTQTSDRRSHRIGAVSYSFQYAVGHFSYHDRKGEKMDAIGFVEAAHAAGGNMAQISHVLIDSLDASQLKRLRDRAEELDVRLEAHIAFRRGRPLEHSLRQAAALGVRVAGCCFGVLTRQNKCATLDQWDAFYEKCRQQLTDMAKMARAFGIVIGVENHTDFTSEELRDLIRQVNSPSARVMFDSGNSLGTLDDPLDAAEILGPFTCGTHIKDYAVEETARGFRLTTVPLGCGSLQVAETIERLAKHAPSDISWTLEAVYGSYGSELEVHWLKDSFWVPFRNKTARQVAACLRHIRSRPINIAELKTAEDVDRLKLSHAEHIEFEAGRVRQGIAYMKDVLADAEQSA